MHVESLLPENIWNPNLMLQVQAAPLGPQLCVWGLMHPGHFTHPQTKIKHRPVPTVAKTGKVSSACDLAAKYTKDFPNVPELNNVLNDECQYCLTNSHKMTFSRTINVYFYISLSTHLVLDSFAVFRFADYSQLQLCHFLHLPIHVYLLQQRANLVPQQTHCVLLSLPLGEQRGAG